MIHILIQILRILGMVLLVLLAILILLMLLVLLVPIRYRGAVKYDKKPKGHIRIAWLFSLITFELKYHTKLKWRLKILGRPIAGSRKEKEAEPETQENEEEPQIPGNEEIPGAGETAAPAEETSESSKAEITITPEEEQDLREELGREIREEHREQEQEETKRKRQKNKAFSPGRRIHTLIERIKEKIQNLGEKISEIRGKADKVLRELEKEENQRTLKLIIRQLIKLLRHVLPRKAEGKVTFGFEDPAVTGEVLAACAFVWPAFDGNLDITPDFDQKIILADAKFRGRIRIGTVLVIAGRLFLDKNFRYWFKKIVRGG